MKTLFAWIILAALWCGPRVSGGVPDLGGGSRKEEWETMLRSGGIHVQISMMDGRLFVERVLPDGPADRAGIRRGDVIVQVETRWMEGMAMEEAVEALRGLPDTWVWVTVERSPGERPVEIRIRREALPPLAGVPARPVLPLRP